MELSTITLSGDELPIRCTLNVLEDIQNEFGDIISFSERLLPVKKDEKKEKNTPEMPDIHAIVFALPRFIDEGIEAHNAVHKIKIERMTPKEIFRRCDMSIIDISLALYRELWRSINAPKQSPPAVTNQN